MPFKSKKQRAKFAALVKEGKLSQETFNEWNAHTPEKIPERAPKPSKDRLQTMKKVKKF